MRIAVRPAARRDLGNIGRENAARLVQAVGALAETPRPRGCILLRGRASRTWRIRVGDYRILYDLDDAAELVTVLRVLHRSQAY